MVMLLLSYIFMVQPLASIGFLGIGGTVTGVKNLQESGTLGLNLPLISVGAGIDSSAILVVIGFFIILMASKYVDMVRDALKVPPFKYGAALGEALQYGYGRADIATRQPGSWMDQFGAWRPSEWISRAKKAGIKPKPPSIA